MPCSMYEGATSGDFAQSAADDARRRADQAMQAANEVTAILCGILKALPPETVNALLDERGKKWFAAHLAHDAQHGR